MPIYSTTDMKCMECGELLSIDEAEEAMSEGCPGCGGTDIDLGD